MLEQRIGLGAPIVPWGVRLLLAGGVLHHPPEGVDSSAAVLYVPGEHCRRFSVAPRTITCVGQKCFP